MVAHMMNFSRNRYNLNAYPIAANTLLGGVLTVRDFEAGRREPTRNNLTAMKAASEAGGIVFR
jgi:hypothetical protein